MHRLSLIILAAAAVGSLSARTALGVADNARLNMLLSLNAERKTAPTTHTDSQTPLFIPQANADGEYTIFITLRNANADTSPLEANGFKLEHRFGASLLGTATPKAIELIANMPEVAAMKLDDMVSILNDNARTLSGIDAVHKGSATLPPFTGKGVIAGVLDRGFDPNHIAFKNADGTNRIKQISYYNEAGEVEQTNTPDGIAAYTYDFTLTTHGQHVLGTMASGNVITDDGANLCGMAPEAEIVLGTGVLTQGNIARSLADFYSYATQQQKPLVVNLSLGNNFGPHDGTDPFANMLNDFASQNGATLVMACGNEAQLPIAVTGQFTEEKPYIQTALAGNDEAYYRYNELSQGVGSVQIWSEDATPFKVEFLVVDLNDLDHPLLVHEVKETDNTFIGSGRAYMNAGISKIEQPAIFKNHYSSGYLGGELKLSEVNNRYCAELMTYLTAKSAAINENTATLIRVTGQPGKRVFIYNDNSTLGFTNRNNEQIDAPTANGTASSICCGKSVISVGAYSSRIVPGGPYLEETVGEMSATSSWATLCDRRTIPDVAAPGTVIYSTMNKGMTTLSSYETDYAEFFPIVGTKTDINGVKHHWTMMGGTSMASPHVAGTVALMLSANPDLTSEEIKLILKGTATAINNPAAGFGKINAMAAVEQASQRNSLGGVQTANPAAMAIRHIGQGSYCITAPGESSLSAMVYTTAGTLAEQQSSPSDVLNLNLSHLAKGTYIVRVKGNNSSETFKIII